MWRKTLWKVGKTGSKTSLKSCTKLAKRTPIYRVQKMSRWAQFSGQIDLSIDRPVDRPTVIFQIIGVTDRLPGRPYPGQRPIGRPVDRPRQEPESTALWSVDCSVDRDQIQRPVGSIDQDKNQRVLLSGRSTGARSREQAL